MRMPRFTPWLAVITLTAAGAAAAAGYGLTAPKRYGATAQLLVVPVSEADSTWAGLGVLQDTAGRRSAAASAAELVRSPQVADAVRAQLGLRRSTPALLDELRSRVAGTSNVVDVSVDDTSPTAAAQLANAFVDALIAQRTASFQSALGSAIKRDAQLLAGGSPGPQAVELARRLAVLRSLQGQPDPTVRRGSVAVAPIRHSWPDVPRLIAVGAAAGLAAGVLLALLLVLWGRRPPSGLSANAPSMGDRSERAAHVLADQLERRLAAREKALAARERDLQARIDELKALDVQPRPSDDADLVERERLLEERVTRRELEVARRAASQPAPDDEQVAARDAALAERERALEEREAAVAAAEHVQVDAEELAGREAALAEGERSLEERVETLTRRELELAREATLSERELDAGRRAPIPAPADAPTPDTRRAPAVADPARPDGQGSYNLLVLERLVDERAERFPERAEEWRSYLFFLRDYAGPDGALPASFDWLVLDTFREIMA